MKFVSVFVLMVVALAACSEARRHMYHRNYIQDNGVRGQFLWFDQRNDHFSKDDVSTWKQRYLVNQSVWRGNGYPIFFMLGGEGPVSDNELAGHFILNEKAEQYGALMVSIEHRFYGESMPGDGTLSLENLRLLSADQALADFAVMIDYIRKTYHAEDSKIVTFGGSYSGSLSAWMRQKYPNLVDIAYATSAPVQAQLDFPEYHEVITDSLGPTCAGRIKEAFVKIEKLIKSDPEKLKKDFNACSPKMTTDLDEITFLESISDVVDGVVQYSGDNNALGRMWNVSRMCNMIGTEGDAYDSYVAYARFFMQSQGEDCMDNNYQDVVDKMRKTDPADPDAASRSWIYQTCVEYGYYQTVESDRVPFSKRVNLDYFLDMCRDIYGTNKNTPGKAVDYTNVYYGGRNVASSKIVFLNGSVDPWHALGFTTETSNPEEMPVFYIKGTGHCADLYSSSKNDLPSLTQAREQAWKYVGKWLNEK